MDIINVSSPNDGLGDKLRDAMVKVNANFAELLNTINTLDFSIAAIDGLQDSLNTLSSSISGLQSQINTLDGRVDNHDSDISTINSNIVTINNTISEILNDLASQETELTDYQTTTNTLLAGLQSDLNDLYTDVQNLQLSLSQYELLTNKATNFSVINNTKYPTTSAVQNYVVSAIAGITGATGSGIIPNLTQVLNVGNTSSNSINLGYLFTDFSSPTYSVNTSMSAGGAAFTKSDIDGENANNRTANIGSEIGFQHKNAVIPYTATKSVWIDFNAVQFTHGSKDTMLGIDELKILRNLSFGQTAYSSLKYNNFTFYKSNGDTNVITPNSMLLTTQDGNNTITSTIISMDDNGYNSVYIRPDEISISGYEGTPIVTMNMDGYSVSSSTGLAVYGATTLTSAGITHSLPNTSNAGKLVTVGTTAPASATATGEVGEIRVTSTYIYTCIARDTWVRSVAATW